MNRPLGVAVVGLGIGEQHARMYATLPSCKVKLLIDLDGARAENLAAEFQGSDAASDFDDALSRDDIDVISIASYDEAHFDQVMRALSAGKHVLSKSRFAEPRMNSRRSGARLMPMPRFTWRAIWCCGAPISIAGFVRKFLRVHSARSTLLTAIIFTGGSIKLPKAGVTKRMITPSCSAAAFT